MAARINALALRFPAIVYCGPSVVDGVLIGLLLVQLMEVK